MILLIIMGRYVILELCTVQKVNTWIIRNYDLKERRTDKFFADERKVNLRILKVRSTPQIGVVSQSR